MVCDRAEIAAAEAPAVVGYGETYLCLLYTSLCRRLSLPAKMTPNAFLGALNILLSKEELYEICKDEAADA